MGYYKLMPTALVTYDANGASIMDTITFERKNYSLEEAHILKEILSKSINEIDSIDEMGKMILIDLMRNGYCYYYKNNPCNDIYKDKRAYEIRGIMEEIPHFKNIFFEIRGLQSTNNINAFCYPYECRTCSAWKRNKELINSASFDLESFVNRLIDLWIDKITLSGGAGLVDENEVERYIRTINKCLEHIPVELNISVSRLSDKLMELIIEKKITLNLTVCAEDWIEKRDDLEYWLEKLSDDIDGRFICVGDMSDDFIQKCQLNQIEIVSVQDNEKKREEDSYNQRIKRKSVNYWNNQKFNHCLNNQLAITVDGDVRPCPMIADAMINLNNSVLDELFKKRLHDKYWRFTKNELELCKECRMKYVCEDCAAVELSILNKQVNSNQMCDRKEYCSQ